MARFNKINLIIIETAIVLLYLFNVNLAFILVLIAKACIFFFLKRRTNTITALFSILVLSIPTSFINILGGKYGLLPISWFNIYFLLIFFYFFSKFNQLKLDTLSLIAIMLSVSLLMSVLVSYDKSQALKDYFNFLVMLFLIIVRTKKLDFKILKESFIIAGYSLVFALLVQIYFFIAYGKVFGKIDIYPMRIAFGATFSDYSFLSLFFATIGGIFFIERQKKGFLFFILC
ncbi:MAG: hypothetical protein QXT38_04525, partial [Candidatus Aenigmatarchaeota archaeon]